MPAGRHDERDRTDSEPAPGEQVSWTVVIAAVPGANDDLPAIDLSKSIYDPVNRPARVCVQIAVLSCPSSRELVGRSVDARREATYAGCHHDLEQPIDSTNHGVLFLNTAVRLRDITDGSMPRRSLSEKRSPRTTTTASLISAGRPARGPRCATPERAPERERFSRAAELARRIGRPWRIG